MSFTVVKGRDDHALDDAVRRGVADGLARLLGVPKHPDSVQAMLDNDGGAEGDGPKPLRAPVRADQSGR